VPWFLGAENRRTGCNGRRAGDGGGVLVVSGLRLHAAWRDAAAAGAPADFNPVGRTSGAGQGEEGGGTALKAQVVRCGEEVEESCADLQTDADGSVALIHYQAHAARKTSAHTHKQKHKRKHTHTHTHTCKIHTVPGSRSGLGKISFVV
jgi:hypothetical protein